MTKKTPGKCTNRDVGSRTTLKALSFPLLLLIAVLSGLGLSQVAVGEETGASESRSGRRWIRSTLAGMSLEEKAAQLVMVRANGMYKNPSSESARALVSEVRDLKVGGVVAMASELESLPRLLNDLQALSDIPLIVAADMERGMSFRVRRGTVSLPSAMAVGASRSAELARFTGEVTAREGRAMGVHWAFAPVADVNNNPANPVINTRSYGEDPDLVARMSSAFVEGAQQGRILTSAKHFPGHGDTSTDSHLSLPVVTADRERLERLEFVPFRAVMDTGVESIMLAHVAVPALDPSGAPATLSPILSKGLLRDELGYTGLIVTDALEMAGIRPAWTGEAAVRSVAAGADLVLLPSDPRVAVQSLVRAVHEGQLTEERLDESVLRLLEAKADLGLHKARWVDPEDLGHSVARPQDVRKSQELTARSITLVRNQGDVLPLRAEEHNRILSVEIASSWRAAASQGIVTSELSKRSAKGRSFVLGPEISDETLEKIWAEAGRSSHVLVSAFVATSSGHHGAVMSSAHIKLFEGLMRTGTPLIVMSFGSPYLLVRVPDLPVYVCAYGSAAVSQRAAVAAIFGETDVAGKLPVTLEGLHSFGHGIELARRPLTLREAAPEEVGFRPGGMEEVDRILDKFVEQGAFPGGVVAVGYRGALVHLRPFGHMTYDEGAPEVVADTIYDLASLTKVLAMTTMTMMLVDDGVLELDKPVQDFLPLFKGPGKETVTVRQLLTHSAGLSSGGPLFLEIEGRAAYLDRIQAMDLEYEPGTRSVYSDLGPILMGEILERVAGVPMDEFLEEKVYGPLGMHDTLYLPGPELHERIAPTEIDSWRGRLVRGEVHDENTHAMGGVAPHAGLFSTAYDLSRFSQMVLNGGVLEHHRIFSWPTVDAFVRRAEVPGSSRAVGWDTKSPEHSSAGSYFSPRSYGHLGFTGTSFWIDPDRELFLILLTNRVHPTRDNALIRKARPAVADAVVQALVDP